MKKFLSFICAGLLLSSCCSDGMRKWFDQRREKKAFDQLRRTMNKEEWEFDKDSLDIENIMKSKGEFSGESEDESDGEDVIEIKLKDEYKRPDKKMLLDTFKQFIATNKKNRPKKEWIGDKPVLGKQMFIEKLEIPDISNVIFIRDPHGEAGALRDLLAEMQKEGWIAKDDCFKLIKKDSKSLYLMFLGDYGDRGDEGAENLYIATSLYIKNPGQVVTIRGNHETVFNAREKEFGKELNIKYKMNDDQIKKVYDVFPYLVGGCFLIWKNIDKNRGIFCSHNTIDPKQDFKPLLLSQNKRFESENIEKKVSGQEGKGRWGLKLDEYSFILPGSRKAKEIDGQRDRDYYKEYEWCFDRIALAQVLKNCNLKNLDIIGMCIGHQQNQANEVLEKGNGVYILPGESNKFQWEVNQSKEISLKSLMQDGKKTLPFGLMFDLFRYNTRTPNKEIYSRGQAFTGWHSGSMPVITLELNPDFKECKFTREMMRQYKK